MATERITTMNVVITAIIEADTETEMITEDAIALVLGTGTTIEGEIALVTETLTSPTDARISTTTDTIDDIRRIVKYAVQNQTFYS